MIEGVRLESGMLWRFNVLWESVRLLLSHYESHCTQTQIVAIYHVAPEKVTLLKEWKITQHDLRVGDPMQKITAEINDWLYARFGDSFSERGLMDRRAAVST